MVLNIITFPVDLLRKKSVPVEKIDDDIKKLAADMLDTLYDVKGYGLAAPQVGRRLRMLVLDETAGRETRRPQVFINPEILGVDGEMLGEEGCLSVPGEYASVKRFAELKVRAFNEKGEEFIVEAKDQLARILQHEIDHLDGILFIDRLPSFKRDTLKKHIKKRIQSGDYVICGGVS
jgi:peptide deformylase